MYRYDLIKNDDIQKLWPKKVKIDPLKRLNMDMNLLFLDFFPKLIHMKIIQVCQSLVLALTKRYSSIALFLTKRVLYSLFSQR